MRQTRRALAGACKAGGGKGPRGFGSLRAPLRARGGIGSFGALSVLMIIMSPVS